MTDVNQLITDHLSIWTAATEKKSSAGRGNGGSVSLHGIKKLRELILELAVRGKLVPQDDTDLPADGLLDQLHFQQTQMYAKSLIKKPKPVAKIAASELPFELPRGWAWCRVSQLGHDWGQKVPDSQFTYIDVGSINKELGLVSEPTVLEASKAPSRARKLVRNGTVIYSTVRPYLLNIAVITETFEPEPIASTAFAIVHPFDGVSASYLYRYFRSPAFISYVEGCQTGIAYPAINDKQFFSGLVPLPPTEEQHRIVAKVDELMALCDALERQAEDSLKAHQTLVETCLATLTNSQSPEELTQNWTRIEAHFDTLFTTEESVEALRDCVWSLAVRGMMGSCAAASSTDGSNHTNDAVPSTAIRKIRKPLPLLSEEDVPFGIPDGWVWLRVCELFQVSSGTSFPAKEEMDSGEYAYIKVADMNLPENQSEIRTSSRFIDPDIKQKKKLIPANSIVFPKRGGAIATNKKRFVRSEIFADLNIMALTVPADISIDYVMIWLKGIDLARLNTGTSVPQINHQDIDPLPFPLPPRPEQDFIVAKVRALEELCDFLKQRLSAQNRLSTNLADALATKFH
ncbi:restriction endonuclease subunit S [Tateyamaria sp. ANG-S1]|uniref:restriction endonuclease subunit S n=1 Tax=Tateyamaria sp. ANG-S1 TaxID=1577905 RepID=UPI00057C7305|nr:restriction endonuclease subunit S [Tateyamaria sp. ANG-S1]KIC50870.1 hypothetical protein RA29_02900 [Tateyamaria sp. ANG-S1]